MSGVELNLPDMSQIMEWVKLYAPTVLMWSLIALVASLVLRILMALAHKKSGLLRAVSWLGAIGAVASLGGYWILTGEVPKLMDDIQALLSGAMTTLPDSLGNVDMKGAAMLVLGAIVAFASRGISRMFSRGKDAGDAEIVIKTIGWLLCIMGALVTLGII